MKFWIETTLSDLYNNTIKAFPTSLKRQNSIDEVVIEHLDWVAFKGMRTLFVKGLAKRGESKNECIILFKNVIYSEEQEKGFLDIKTSNGETVFVKPLSYDSNDVLVRCSCKDFYWRMTHFNKIDGSLYGRDRAKYEAVKNPESSNPSKLPGLCKHLIKMSKTLSQASLIK